MQRACQPMRSHRCSACGVRHRAARRRWHGVRGTLDVDDLKRRVLQQLLVHPQLAAEFLDMVTEEHGAGEDPVDREIIEVSNASVGQDPGRGKRAEPRRPDGTACRERARERVSSPGRAGNGTGDRRRDGPADPRRGVRERRACAGSSGRCRKRLNVYQQDLSPEALEAYRVADQAYLRARSEAPENPHR